MNRTIRGIGRDRIEAERAALDQFVRENGHHAAPGAVNDAKLLRRVPPRRTMTESGTGRQYEDEDRSAPAGEWLEEWEFEVSTDHVRNRHP